MGGKIDHGDPLDTTGIEQADTGLLEAIVFDYRAVTRAAHPPVDRGLLGVERGAIS
jgi:hypothetical protein